MCDAKSVLFKQIKFWCIFYSKNSDTWFCPVKTLFILRLKHLGLSRLTVGHCWSISPNTVNQLGREGNLKLPSRQTPTDTVFPPRHLRESWMTNQCSAGVRWPLWRQGRLQLRLVPCRHNAFVCIYIYCKICSAKRPESTASNKWCCLVPFGGKTLVAAAAGRQQDKCGNLNNCWVENWPSARQASSSPGCVNEVSLPGWQCKACIF